MSTTARGTKRVCPSCGARFYDLNRMPITCPVCQTVYQLPSAGRRSRIAAANPAEPEEEAEEVVAVTEDEPEIISLEDAEETVEAKIAEDEEDLGDLAADDAELPDDADEDDTFLEQDEDDGEAGVSGLLGGSDRGDEV